MLIQSKVYWSFCQVKSVHIKAQMMDDLIILEIPILPSAIAIKFCFLTKLLIRFFKSGWGSKKSYANVRTFKLLNCICFLLVTTNRIDGMIVMIHFKRCGTAIQSQLI